MSQTLYNVWYRVCDKRIISFVNKLYRISRLSLLISCADKLADVIGLAKFFVQQIKLASSDSQKGVFLECLLAVLKTLETFHVCRSEMFGLYVK